MSQETTPTNAGEPQAEAPQFLRLKRVETYTATSKEESQVYLRENIKRQIPRLTQLREFMRIKGDDHPIVLIGGGPSLKRKEVVEELKEYAAKYPTMAAGSSHDWCVANGITPTYASVVDPDPIALNYVTKPSQNTVYLIASQCHPSVFESLKDYKVAMWHCYSEADKHVFEELEPNFFGVGGGCTVGMRSINISLLLGHNRVHLFGYDSCLGDDDVDHAYDLTDEREMLGLLGQNGKVYDLKLGVEKPEGNSYRCMGYHLAQLQHFHELYSLYFNIFTPVVHGGGPMADIVELVKKEKLGA